MLLHIILVCWVSILSSNYRQYKWQNCVYVHLIYVYGVCVVFNSMTFFLVFILPLQCELWSTLCVVLHRSLGNIHACQQLHLIERCLDQLRRTKSDRVASKCKGVSTNSHPGQPVLIIPGEVIALPPSLPPYSLPHSSLPHSSLPY